jgi:hypothetical protein
MKEAKNIRSLMGGYEKSGLGPSKFAAREYAYEQVHIE